ncbi:uncharacterized protein LOC108102391 [Drosophila eugracilis]|uniref:uncharacterized protein LOC108102391 n=1 Tax=Drosophila eugracilis TaxID=29029 RepID=UPI0007E848D4|nr:uncharacterized protein LOC108102391 [Drosophila eugracilis]
MAPRKRISKIASRSALPPVQTAESTTHHSVCVQTDAVPLGSLKRKWAQNKVKSAAPLIPPPQQLATHLMPAVNPQAASSASIMMSGPAEVLPSSFPGPNEKSCQAVYGGKLNKADRVIIANSGGREMNYLKLMVNNRREEANQWDRTRLETLLAQINHDPPPRWHVATQMWMEVDQLEERIEAYDKKELLNAKKSKMDHSLD